MKRVRVTIEVTESFVGLLCAQIRLHGRIRGHLPGTKGDADGELTPSDVLALVAAMEAKGELSHVADAAVPLTWRPEINVIHEERRVYEGGELVGSGA